MAAQFISSRGYRLRESVPFYPRLVLAVIAVLCLGPSRLSAQPEDNTTSVTPTAGFTSQPQTELVSTEDATTLNRTYMEDNDTETTPDAVPDFISQTQTDFVSTEDATTVITTEMENNDTETTPDAVTEIMTTNIVTADDRSVTTVLITMIDDVITDSDTTTDVITDRGTDLQTETATTTVAEYDDNVTIVLNATQDGVGNDTTTAGQTTGLPLSTLTLKMRFTISNMNHSEITEDSAEEQRLTIFLEDELKKLYSDTPKFKSVNVLGYRNGSVVVDVKLTFTSALDLRERNDAMTTLFEVVVLNGTLGALQLQDLKLLEENGKVKDLDDACDIRPCIGDMTCRPDETKCAAKCSYNKAYCRNKSTCLPNNDYISCKCKKGYFGERCDKTPRAPGTPRGDNAFIGIVAAAATAVVLCLVVIVGCGYNRFVNRGKSPDTSKLFSAENPVALEMLDEPPPIIGGVGCQTIESFLLAKYMRHGVPPKPGFQHEIVQTTDSFLLARYQQEREALLDSPPNGTGATPPPPPVSTSVPSTLETDSKDGPIDRPGDQGISNKAFVDDDADIVPTAEVEGDDTKTEIGKKIIKV